MMNDGRRKTGDWRETVYQANHAIQKENDGSKPFLLYFPVKLAIYTAIAAHICWGACKDTEFYHPIKRKHEHLRVLHSLSLHYSTDEHLLSNFKTKTEDLVSKTEFAIDWDLFSRL